MEQKCANLYSFHNQKLNERLGDLILKAKDPDSTLMHVCEGLRCLREIKSRYDRDEGFDIIALGNDDAFQMGIMLHFDDDKDLSNKPTVIERLPREQVVQVAAGGLHSVGLMKDGSVYTWGCNDDGALGRTGVTEETSHCLKEVTEGFQPEDKGHIMQVTAGDSHSLFLSLDGNVYMSGMYKDTDSGKFRDLAKGEKLKSKSGKNEIPVLLDMPGKVKKICSGHSWNAAVLNDDTLVTWGK